MPSAGKAPINLDGTTLEGGGQLLRVALSLSALTHVPVQITNIRGKRGHKGQAGGLKTAHLAAAQWLAKACEAETEGLVIKSRELVFQPSRVTGVIYEKTVADETLGGLWKNVYDENDKLIRRESHIPMSTPGSVFLVFQAILPFILFSRPRSPSGSISTAAAGAAAHYGSPIRITIQGGTNDTNAPSLEYVDQVLLPMLSAKVGIPPITMKLEARGWIYGRPKVGSVTFNITPLSSPVVTRDAIRDMVIARLLKNRPDVEILFPVNEDTRDSRRLSLLLVAETSNGYRLGRDWLYDRKTTGSSTKVVDELVSRVVNGLEEELSHGGCVDGYLQDQLVVFQALAEGRASVDYGNGNGKEVVSLLTKTVQWVPEEILGATFSEAGTCDGGCGYKTGENNWERSDETEEQTKGLIDELGKLKIEK